MIDCTNFFVDYFDDGSQQSELEDYIEFFVFDELKELCAGSLTNAEGFCYVGSLLITGTKTNCLSTER